VRERLREAAATTLDDYVRACRDRERVRRALDMLLGEVDALILPVSPCEAPLIDGTARVNGKDVVFAEVGIPLRGPVNVTGLPAIAIPVDIPGRPAAVDADRGAPLGRGQGPAHRPRLRGGDARAAKPPPGVRLTLTSALSLRGEGRVRARSP
jgi:hypothetical protein